MAQLRFFERQTIAHLLEAGKSPAYIAKVMGRHRSTICREIKRNQVGEQYQAEEAQKEKEFRRYLALIQRKGNFFNQQKRSGIHFRPTVILHPILLFLRNLKIPQHNNFKSTNLSFYTDTRLRYRPEKGKFSGKNHPFFFAKSRNYTVRNFHFCLPYFAHQVGTLYRKFQSYWRRNFGQTTSTFKSLRRRRRKYSSFQFNSFKTIPASMNSLVDQPTYANTFQSNDIADSKTENPSNSSKCQAAQGSRSPKTRIEKRVMG
ncbi:helix-turn-helix domain-containing protein [Persicobacter sp. CCB-QB2]|uniref:helix-turn-helix domain-containing protein n=1 Tax=Persicobacter sp. CCB-QB2 TaxID=1561025 RepID=UPI0006A95586|nr:helix-turn-helix domain-containing protein [Persicobacter sp. CCB-QB2]